MKLFLVSILCFVFLQQNMIQVSWSYPFNNSTYRDYVCIGCTIDSIAESGNEYPEYVNENGAIVEYVRLHGDVDDGIITIIPLQPCWQLTMTSDYQLLKRTWNDSNCYRIYLPLI